MLYSQAPGPRKTNDTPHPDGAELGLANPKTLRPKPQIPNLKLLYTYIYIHAYIYIHMLYMCINK